MKDGRGGEGGVTGGGRGGKWDKEMMQAKPEQRAAAELICHVEIATNVLLCCSALPKIDT